jgi:hypothetical protein
MKFGIHLVEEVDHYHQFVDAVLGKAKTSASSDYAGPLTEAAAGAAGDTFPKTSGMGTAKMKFTARGKPHVCGEISFGWNVNQRLSRSQVDRA